jgi:hypothetical protein
MFCGMFSACDGYLNYWSKLFTQLKFFSVIAAFVVLLVLGPRKLEKREV